VSFRPLEPHVSAGDRVRTPDVPSSAAAASLCSYPTPDVAAKCDTVAVPGGFARRSMAARAALSDTLTPQRAEHAAAVLDEAVATGEACSEAMAAHWALSMPHARAATNVRSADREAAGGGQGAAKADTGLPRASSHALSKRSASSTQPVDTSTPPQSLPAAQSAAGDVPTRQPAVSAQVRSAKQRALTLADTSARRVAPILEVRDTARSGPQASAGGLSSESPLMRRQQQQPRLGPANLTAKARTANSHPERTCAFCIAPDAA
jgi:hypothetical protein